jgi:hypothetical protein
MLRAEAAKPPERGIYVFAGNTPGKTDFLRLAQGISRHPSMRIRELFCAPLGKHIDGELPEPCKAGKLLKVDWKTRDIHHHVIPVSLDRKI